MSHDEQDCEICPRGSHEIESPTKEPYTGHKCIEYAKFGNCEHVSTKESPAVEGWESGFDAIWVRGQHDTTPYHLCKDFIRSQITKAKEEERRATIAECVGIVKGVIRDLGSFSGESFVTRDIQAMGLITAKDILQAIKFLLPTGDNKQGT